MPPVAVGLAVTLLLIGTAVFASLAIGKPIRRIGSVLMRLANGHTDVVIPYTSRGDEIGEFRCGGQGGGAVPAAQIEDLHAGRDPELGDELLAALAHAGGDAGEVALLPESLVRIHRSAFRKEESTIGRALVIKVRPIVLCCQHDR